MVQRITPLRRKEGNLRVAWAENVADGDQSDAAFSTREQRAAMVIQFEEKDYDSLLPGAILGYPRRGNGQLNRVIPLQHPLFTWLFATAITTIKGRGYDGAAGNTGRTNYPRQFFGVAFTSVPFDVLTDAEVRDTGQPQEWTRWTDIQGVARTQAISRDPGSFAFDDTGTAGAPTTDVKAGIAILHTVTGLKVLWYEVPRNYIFSETKLGHAANFVACAGRLNDAEFLGWPAGTLLCESPDFTPTEAPVPPSLMVPGVLDRSCPRTYTVGINLKAFEHGGPSAVEPGWNAYPTAGGQFYRIRTKETDPADRRTQYQTASFKTMFDPV